MEDKKIFKVAISIPSEGHTLPEAYDNHLLVAYHLGALETLQKKEGMEPRFEFFWYTTGRILTPLARERLIEQALKEEMDYILMFDDDMILPIDMVEFLLQDMLEHPEIDILAPLAFMRNPPHYAVMYTCTEGYDPVRHQEYYINDFVRNYPKDTLVECDAVGFGAVCIKIEMLKKLKAPYCFSTTGTGEDIWLCVKARKEAKARVFMDTRVKLGHLGKPIIIDEAYFEKYIKDNNLEIPDIPHKYLVYDH